MLYLASYGNHPDSLPAWSPLFPITSIVNNSASEETVMGASPRFPYPKEVWSPSGGWWAFPKAWRPNTAVAFVLVAAICVPVAMLSERKMVR